MTQLAERPLAQLDDAEIANGLAILYFEDNLTRQNYDRALQELIRRKFAPEALGTLILFGELEWQKPYR